MTELIHEAPKNKRNYHTGNVLLYNTLVSIPRPQKSAPLIITKTRTAQRLVES